MGKSFPSDSILNPWLQDRPATKTQRSQYQLVEQVNAWFSYYGMRRQLGATPASPEWLIWVEYYGTDGQWHSQFANDVAAYVYKWVSRATYFPTISVSPTAPPAPAPTVVTGSVSITGDVFVNDVFRASLHSVSIVVDDVTPVLAALSTGNLTPRKLLRILNKSDTTIYYNDTIVDTNQLDGFPIYPGDIETISLTEVPSIWLIASDGSGHLVTIQEGF